MPKLIDITGEVFGGWTVIRRAPRNPKRKDTSTYWVCRCQCGAIKEVASRHLRFGNTHQCMDCLRAQNTVPQEQRICTWCGNPSGKAKTARSCAACNQAAQRYGRWPCNKPRRVEPPRKKPVREHRCRSCRPWPRRRKP